MAGSVTKAPTADEAVSGTWTGSVGSRWSVVDDYPDTAPTDFLTHGTTTAGNLTFTAPAFSLPSIASSITVLVDYYDRKNGTQSCNVAARLKVGGSYFAAASHNPANAVITQRTDTFATNPKTAAAWTPAQINGTDGVNDLQAFGWVSTDANPSIDLTSIQIRVTYTANYTLTAVQGSYTLTGNAVTFLRSHNPFPVAQGSYALTGNAVTLTYTPAGPTAYTMSAVQGSYALTGNAALLKAGRYLAPVQGAYTLTGNAVNLTYTPTGPQAYTMAAAQGSYTITASAAALTYSGLQASTAQVSNSINELCRRGIVGQIDGTAGLTGGSGAARAMFAAIRRTHVSDERALDNYCTGLGTYNTVGLDRKIDEAAAIEGCSCSITLNHDLSLAAYKALVTGAEWGNSVTGAPSNRRPKGVSLNESITSGLYPQMVADLQHQIDRCIDRWTNFGHRNAVDLHFELTREPFFGGSHGLAEGAWGTYVSDTDADFYDFWEYALPLLNFHGHRLWSWSVSGYSGIKYYRGTSASTSALAKNRALLNAVLGSARFQALMPYFTYNGIPQINATLYAPIQGFGNAGPGLAAEVYKIMLDDMFDRIDAYSPSRGAELLITEMGLTRQWCGQSANGIPANDFQRGRILGRLENEILRYRRVYSSCLYVLRENMDGSSDTVHGIMDDNTFNPSRAVQGLALEGWGQQISTVPTGSTWIGATGESAPF